MIIRAFDPACDRGSVIECFIELQNFERQLDPGMPEGSTVADVCLDSMLARCEKWAGRILVAEADSKIVGFICVWSRVPQDEPDEDPTEFAFIAELVVRATHRGQGVGKKLMDAAEQFARENGASIIRICVLANNEPAKRLYEQSGYEPFEIQMVKHLG